MLQHYENQSCPEAAHLLQADAITYSVLIQILQGTCTDIYTDHESIVICYSFPPYPIWVWCGEPEDPQHIETIAHCLKTAFPVERDFCWNLSMGLLERLQTEDPYFRQIRPQMPLLSYRLDAIQPISHTCDGAMCAARSEDIPFLSEVWHDMAFEMEGFDLDREQCHSKVRSLVENGDLFLWHNGAQQIVALTARRDSPPYCKISAVYTLPQHRRRGYAINLVHSVTQSILQDGLIPILYTDASYAASNSCYRKIGFQIVGNLVKTGK